MARLTKIIILAVSLPCNGPMLLSICGTWWHLVHAAVSLPCNCPMLLSICGRVERIESQPCAFLVSKSSHCNLKAGDKALRGGNGETGLSLYLRFKTEKYLASWRAVHKVRRAGFPLPRQLADFFIRCALGDLAFLHCLHGPGCHDHKVLGG